jgi:hypothetical protein
MADLPYEVAQPITKLLTHLAAGQNCIMKSSVILGLIFNQIVLLFG